MAEAGAGPGGASGETCETCADNAENGACMMQFEDCMPPGPGSPDCEAWWDCYTDECFANDFTAACFAQCDMDFMSEASFYGPLKACLCTECAGECAPFCP